MNIECDRCEYCEYYKLYKDKKNTWQGICNRYKIKRMDESESCEQFIFSKDAIENYKLKAESVEHGGVKESERFE